MLDNLAEKVFTKSNALMAAGLFLTIIAGMVQDEQLNMKLDKLVDEKLAKMNEGNNQQK